MGKTQSKDEQLQENDQDTQFQSNSEERKINLESSNSRFANQIEESKEESIKTDDKSPSLLSKNRKVTESLD